MTTPTRAVLATLLSAALLGLTFPPFSLRPLAFVGLVPFLLASRSGGLRRAAAMGALFGVAYGWSTAYAFPGSIATYYDRPLWFGLVVGTVLFGLMASLYYLGFSVVDRWLQPRSRWLDPFLTAAIWTSAELGRGRLFNGSDFFIGNPWGLLGYSHATGSLAQIAAWTGVYGIGFAIVSVNAGIAGWIGARDASAGDRRRARRAAALACVPALAGALFGAQLLRASRDTTDADALAEVAVVQGSLAIGRRWRAENYGRNLDVYLELTREALRVGTPHTVVWPESAMTFFLEQEAVHSAAVLDLVSAANLELIAGGPGRGDGDVFNSVFQLVGPEGLRARYDKELLLPFSESHPLGSSRLMRREFDGVGRFAPGPAHPEPLDTRLGRAGLLVCNEAMLPEIARDRVRSGAEILINPSNDGWIGDAGFGEHMLAVVGLRAIEQRRYLVRASTSGPSAIVDPFGRVTVRTPAGGRHLLRGGVRPHRARTVYGRIGDAFALACLAGVGLSAAAHLRVRGKPERGRT